MSIIPTRKGYCFTWETGEISERTGNPLKKEFCHTDRKVVEEKQKEISEKGFKADKITECAF